MANNFLKKEFLLLPAKQKNLDFEEEWKYFEETIGIVMIIFGH